ncbi:HPt (histidine-containing phosphotransfer) domain-containing protein [Pseudarthrobacter siccitolerans]|uniref:HPt (Histidine-containing phosphotransfer) domain-containing protein n=1 Tax=Pseudarthrobacter siccitolerans TaxID=861266 RepID=A0ABU0PIC0_9MICC|nr:Hpt domain-containing protein [Pseudarthrobacter siccitolerans]MDQ0673698.1 HPt (histidine-containing phosphotransfer) domain-containing protein [Pseudarthrobacter siccitolerans]
MDIADPQPSGKGTPPAAVSAESAVTEATGMTPDYEVLLPLVDTDILEELEEQLDGPALAVRFARDYAAMWDQRCAKLAAAVHNQDMDAALDAVISLKITSAMVGGLRLSRLAELLESVIRQGNFGQGQILMKRVAEDGNQTVSELQASYILKND